MGRINASSATKGLLVMACLFILCTVFSLSAHAESAPRTRFPHHSATVLHIKFKDSANVSLVGGNFVGQDAGLVNNLLSQSKAQSKQQLFQDSASNLKANSHGSIISNAKVSDLSQYYSVKIPNGQDAQAISDRLRSLAMVEDAYPEPLPAPPPASPSYTSLELFRNTAPDGIDAKFASTWPGGLGGQIKLADLEYNWNTNHEDLSKARAADALIHNGTTVDPFPANNQSINHGTSVLGITSGDVNSFGVTGIVPNSRLRLVNTYSAEQHWSLANAIYLATNNMNAGDVMLIEQQACGPTDPQCMSGFVPVEWIPEIYDAIVYATSKNITVIEPAADGNQNLDDTSLYGTAFPSGKSDSGAIIVGEAVACSDVTPVRSRQINSNYGARVNMQGPGECVTTAGVGDLYNGGDNALYTSKFNGTSSASAIVAGAAASFASSYKYLNGVAPSPTLVRSILQTTGTQQNFAPGSLEGNIGPMPNMAKAMPKADLKNPTAPTKLSASLNANKKVVLKWTAATDNVGIASYRIYRNNLLIKTITPGVSYTDITVVAQKTYQYKLVAVDRAGRLSPSTPIVSITTK